MDFLALILVLNKLQIFYQAFSWFYLGYLFNYYEISVNKDLIYRNNRTKTTRYYF